MDKHFKDIFEIIEYNRKLKTEITHIRDKLRIEIRDKWYKDNPDMLKQREEEMSNLNKELGQINASLPFTPESEWSKFGYKAKKIDKIRKLQKRKSEIELELGNLSLDMFFLRYNPKIK